MDERAVLVEGTETRQGELIIEDGSVGNGIIDADGAQARGAERVSIAQGVRVVERSDPMDSEGIAGTGTQFGAAEDVEAETDGTGSGTATYSISNEEWEQMSPKQRKRYRSNQKKKNGGTRRHLSSP